MPIKMRRFNQLTNAFSRKMEYQLYPVALHAMRYDYRHPHKTLMEEAGGIKTTSAMPAGLAHRP